jgi:hypothetical protein
MHLYFAYGSNLDEAQMRRRCPSARRVARASLPDHALGFAGYSGRWDGAVAHVRAAVGGTVEGLLYALDDEALRALDGYEGYPLKYDRVLREVCDEAGAVLHAHVYVLADGAVEGPPSDSYLEVIARAYEALAFDLGALHAAAAAAR